MTISPISTSAAASVSTRKPNPFAKIKQDFDAIGAALQSGNLSDAQSAFAQLQKDAPAPPAGQGNNPLSSKIDALSKALASGDLNGAKQAFADIQVALPKRPTGGPAGGRHAGGGDGDGDGKKTSSTGGSSSSSSKTYDKKDLNQDGKVSAIESFIYDATHTAAAAQGASSAKTASDATASTTGNTIDLTA